MFSRISKLRIYTFFSTNFLCSSFYLLDNSFQLRLTILKCKSCACQRKLKKCWKKIENVLNSICVQFVVLWNNKGNFAEKNCRVIVSKFVKKYEMRSLFRSCIENVVDFYPSSVYFLDFSWRYNNAVFPFACFSQDPLYVGCSIH